MQNKPHHVKTVEEAILHPSALYGFGNALDPSPLYVQKSSGSRLPAKKAFPLSCKQPNFSFVPSHESLCASSSSSSSSSSSPSLCNRFGYSPALPRGSSTLLCFALSRQSFSKYFLVFLWLSDLLACPSCVHPNIM